VAKDLTLELVKRILERGVFPQLIGGLENYKIECKRSTYNLAQLSQKRELAKDVSGFANAEGGIILLGVETRKSLAHPHDEIKAVHGFPQDLLKASQFHNVLRTWIYPSLGNVEIKWFQSKQNISEGIGVIEIPEQSRAKRPFLITKTIEPSQGGKIEKITEILFGLVERRRDETIPTSVQELHSQIRDGRNFSFINEQLELIKETLQTLQLGKVPESEPQSAIQELLDGRIGLVLSELDLGEKEPTFVLVAKPLTPVEFPDLFSSRDSTIVHLLEKPPTIRSSGFDLDVGGNAARIVEGGKRRRSLESKYKTLNLWRDGTLIFAADATDFVCWRPFDQNNVPLRIHQLALIESTFLFSELSKLVFNEALPKPGKVRYRLELKNITVNGVPCGLVPGIPGDYNWKFGRNIHRASGSQIRAEIDWNSPDIDSGALSYRLICSVYEQFGMEHDKIPYTEEGKAGSGINFVVSPSEIRRLHAF